LCVSRALNQTNKHQSSAARSLTGRGARTEVLWRRLTAGAAERLPLWQADRGA